MPANTDLAFVAVPDNSNNASPAVGGGVSGALTAAANDFTGAGANNQLEFTAGANGAFLEKLRFKALGTNVVTVARIFLNNGNTNGTASNNTMIGEIALPATTSSAVTLTGPDIDYVLNARLSPGWRIYVGLATAVAAGWQITAFGGQF